MFGCCSRSAVVNVVEKHDFDFTDEIKCLEAELLEQKETKRKILRELDLFVLDNLIRETTVG